MDTVKQRGRKPCDEGSRDWKKLRNAKDYWQALEARKREERTLLSRHQRMNGPSTPRF